MTLEEYILNPMGRNNAVMNASAREYTRNNYKAKFDKIMLRENGKIDYFLYYDSKRNNYWAHFKIPSETVRKFYYDVILKFSAEANVPEGGLNLLKYNVQFFSNDPSFVYTYANVFYKNNLLIPELKPKMSKLALKKSPEEKNPNNLVGYVKTIYFAYLLIENRKLNSTNKFKGESKNFNLHKILTDTEDADKKVEEREEEGAKLKPSNSRNKSESRTKKVFPSPNVNLGVKISSVIKPTKNTKFSKVTKPIRSTIKKK